MVYDNSTMIELQHIFSSTRSHSYVFEITESVRIGNRKRVLKERRTTVHIFSSTITPLSSSSTSVALRALTRLRKNCERFSEILVTEMEPPKEERNVQELRRKDAAVKHMSPKERTARLLQIFDGYYNESDKSVSAPWTTLKRIKEKFEGLLPPGRDVGIQGSVPGVNVGQRFRFRAELALLGLHRPPQAGIDWKKTGTIITRDPTSMYKVNLVGLSVVVSAGYENNVDEGETLFYTGEGGGHQSGSKKQVWDQKLTRGNQALVNNITKNKPVRVIRAYGKRRAGDFYYSFDGLYKVEDYEFVSGKSGFNVFKFKLVREPGQKPLLWPPVNVGA